MSLPCFDRLVSRSCWGFFLIKNLLRLNYNYEYFPTKKWFAFSFKIMFPGISAFNLASFNYMHCQNTILLILYKCINSIYCTAWYLKSSKFGKVLFTASLATLCKSLCDKQGVARALARQEKEQYVDLDFVQMSLSCQPQFTHKDIPRTQTHTQNLIRLKENLSGFQINFGAYLNECPRARARVFWLRSLQTSRWLWSSHSIFLFTYSYVSFIIRMYICIKHGMDGSCVFKSRQTCFWNIVTCNDWVLT